MKPRLRCEGDWLWICYAMHPRGFVIEACGIRPEIAYKRLMLALALNDPFSMADLRGGQRNFFKWGEA